MKNEQTPEPKVLSSDLKWWQTVLIFVALLLVLAFACISYGAAVPNPLYKILLITSGSMAPAIDTGDLVCLSPIKEDLVLKPGDIVTFVNEFHMRETHRIVEIKPTGEIVTKGDANNTIDSSDNGWTLRRENLIGIYAFKIPKLGLTISSLQKVLNIDASAAFFRDRDYTISIFLRFATGTSISPDAPLPPEPSVSSDAPLSPEPSVSPEPTLTPETPLTPEPSVSPEPSIAPQPPSEDSSVEPSEEIDAPVPEIAPQNNPQEPAPLATEQP